jgi:hypothetical protein
VSVDAKRVPLRTVRILAQYRANGDVDMELKGNPRSRMRFKNDGEEALFARMLTPFLTAAARYDRDRPAGETHVDLEIELLDADGSNVVASW